MKKIELDGGCTVLSPEGNAGAPLAPVIGAAFGATHISQQILTNPAGLSPIFSFGASQVVLFMIAGNPAISIAGKPFHPGPEAGLCVRPGEAFQVDGEANLLVTVCPEIPVQTLNTMPDNFDEAYPLRLVAPNAAKKEEMGERYYQVLVGKKAGSSEVTQFIGEIPLSKAPSHFHLYEEALYILSGVGRMWTGETSAPVGPGSIIFLPAKQEHSLECTSKDGLRLAGHFYPAGSPAENY